MQSAGCKGPPGSLRSPGRALMGVDIYTVVSVRGRRKVQNEQWTQVDAKIIEFRVQGPFSQENGQNMGFDGVRDQNP